jgi:hypothetical protein
MEKRKLKIRVKGVYHLGDLNLGVSAQEQAQIDALMKDGMSPMMAKDFVLKMRKNPSTTGEMAINIGEVVTVIGRVSWPETANDPNPTLFFYSAGGIVGAVKLTNTDPV